VQPATAGQVPREIVDQLLDPALWRPGLEQFALATNVAVQLFDNRGKPIGDCLNPQPLWEVLVSRGATAGGCAFCASSNKCCTCLAEASELRDIVFARDRTGLVHFAVPLIVEQRVFGGLLAGQVFDQYPETFSLGRAARESGLSPQEIWAIACRAHPVKTATLRIYAELLATLASAIVEARYKSFLESQRMDQLRQAQRLESIGILAGGVAHDFNNLLTGVLVNAKLILDDVPPDHPARTRAEEIAEAAQRAAGLTRQLLAYSGKGTFDIQRIDLSALVRDTSELTRLSIPKNVSLELELAEALPAINADASQIQQIIMNLVINGAEAITMEKQGSVVMRTGIEDIDEQFIQRTLISDVEPGRYVFLEVQDTGYGMDAPTLARIFDPFFTTKFTGRGLGLAAVLGIIRGHKGTVQVQTAPGEGTTFKVLFPASDSTTIPPRPKLEMGTLRGSGTILVVDDEAIVRKVAQAALEQSGYTVISADSGEAAIDLFRKATDEIAIVLLDMTMPGLSGYETFLELKRARPAVKVLLSSGYNEMETTQRFAGQRLAGFLQKPYTAAALGEKIREVLTSIDE